MSTTTTERLTDRSDHTATRARSTPQRDAREDTPLHHRDLDLHALARMDVAELGALYARGATPATLSVLDGHPRGRMLAVRGLDRGARATLLRSVAGAAFFPWGGKSFSAGTERDGRGINRVHLGGRHQLFPFLTRIDASQIDGAPCVVLDYDLADNPVVIRAIHDEVREISPGLFLGPAMWKRADGSTTFVLWFGLDTRVQSTPIGARA